MTNFGDFRLTVFGQFNPTLTEVIIMLVLSIQIMELQIILDNNLFMMGIQYR